MNIESRFPCERALQTGDRAVFTTDVFYCVDCYDYASTIRPEMTGNARQLTLKRGVTCGGGAAED